MKKTMMSFILAFVMVFALSSNCFAYVESATQGVGSILTKKDVFYNADGTVKMVYTPYEDFQFQILGNSDIRMDLTQVFLSKESKKGEYGAWVNANVTNWGTASGGPGYVNFGPRFYKFLFPSEGTYKVRVYTYNSNGNYLGLQEFGIVYNKNNVGVRPTKYLSEPFVDAQAFTNTNGYWSRVSFVVHDLTYTGVTAKDISLALCNQYWMAASYGHASTYRPTDITITPSTVNHNEYTVTATINATLFKNISGEYYIECAIKTNNSYTNFSKLFPRIYIN